MLIMVIAIICYVFGYLVMFLTDLFPFLRVAFMHWFATIFFIVPFIYSMYRLKMGECFSQADGGFPKWKHLIYYLRRDNQVIPLIGNRAFPGESFIDVPQLGLIEFLGKDCVYSWGDKKIVFALENVNFTPDPRHFNFNHILYSIGFKNTEHMKQVLNGDDLESMGNIYLKMLKWDKTHGTQRLMKQIYDYDGPPVQFRPGKEIVNKNIRNPHDMIVEKVDKLWKK